jgi:hypothetical protein
MRAATCALRKGARRTAFHVISGFAQAPSGRASLYRPILAGMRGDAVMTVIARVRVVLVCAGLVMLLTSMVVARAKEARSARAAAAIENATRVSPPASAEEFARAAANYWR